jgi:hypothetical protein
LIIVSSEIHNVCMIAENDKVVHRRKYIGQNRYGYGKRGKGGKRKGPDVELELQCIECLRGDPPVRNTNVSNKKRKLCAQHYREFRHKNSCSVEGCPKLIKNEKKKLCAEHDHGNDDAKSCRVNGCDKAVNQRHNICDTCYMREYRKKKQKSLREYKEEETNTKFPMEIGDSSVSRRYKFVGGISLLPEEVGVFLDKPEKSMMSVYIIQRFAEGIT